MTLPRLVFATRNPGKVKEIAQLLDGHFTVVGLDEIGCHEDVPETADTIAGNAIQKAEYVKQHYNVDCFADDTGLEVSALNGAPGVYTARYAGPEKDANANMDKLLGALQGQPDRGARFKTVIALTSDQGTQTFEGICRGTIAMRRSGVDGFGYDPVFMPEESEATFAEMEASEKNRISHRGKAVRAMVAKLKNNG
ncbi:MAG TPA: non-canonical purine NTP pyrophosphatase [Flavobacteriales bacterium]|jgi:XTP/dITP diphosphohydrolase|nr:non-canonical purine NTP pyrophosphatase [Flavobacteriales bacterium]